MATFNGYSFIYDGTPCDVFGLGIYDIDGNGQKENSNFKANLRTVTLPQAYESTFLGYESKENLTFPMTLVSEKEIDAYTHGKICKWLLNQSGYKKLQIIQPDLSSVIYYCVITSLTTISIGGYAHAFNVEVETNSPFQYENNKIVSKVFTTSGTLTIVNNSDINDYVFPDVTITSTSGGDVEIVNTSDANRSFKITGLSTGEVITIGGKTQSLVSSTEINRLENFNKHWFRLKDGSNVLTVIGSATIKFEIPVIRMVGA